MFRLDPTLTAAATAIAERLVNQALALDPASRERLKQLDGSTVHIHCKDIELNIYLTPGAHELKVQSYCEQSDIQISGSPLALARLALSKEKQSMIRESDISVRGDTERAELFQSIISQLDVDWEAGLAEVVGDIPAHFLGQRLRRAVSWGKQAGDKLGLDIQDYVQEESASFPRKREVEEHMDELDQLKLRIDRIQARVQALDKKILRATDTNETESI